MKKKGEKSILAEIKNVLAIIIITVLCLYALMANSNRAGSSSLPMSFGIGGAIVATGSMEPTLPTNSYILVKAQDNYYVGDIVAYVSERSVVVHRITAINGKMITTKGDANNAEDPEFPAENIKGKVIFKIPGAGKVINVLKTPFGGMMLVLIAFFFLLISRGKTDEEKEETDEQKKEDPAKVFEEDNGEEAAESGGEQNSDESAAIEEKGE